VSSAAARSAAAAVQAKEAAAAACASRTVPLQDTQSFYVSELPGIAGWLTRAR
jgi:hypothetical protein